MSLEGKNTLIVMPTYNEIENLPLIVGENHKRLPDAHILVVDDGSPDGTGELADKLAEGDQRIHVLHRTAKEGLGKAYVAGFKWALEREYKFIMEMDCDFSHRPDHLPEFMAAIQDADLVLGSRYIPGGGTENWGFSRKLISGGGNLYARTVLGLPYRDLTGGFKCFRREVLEAIPLDGLMAYGYAFQIELTCRTHRKGFRVQEIPIIFPDRVRGESKMSGTIFKEAFVMVWRLRKVGK